MKKLSMIIIGTLLSMSLFAQSSYEEAMQTALGKFGSAASINELQAAASQFERIAELETEEWLPAYYASLIYCIITFRTDDPQKKEAFLKQSQSLIDNAMKVAPNESEIYTLQGMHYQAYIGIDPARNGQIYGPKASGAFQTAIKLNADNPRPYYLQAVSLMHTPREYGGGNEVALPLFEQAMKLFNSSTTENSFYPNWGKEDCEQNLLMCKKE
jgi:hypothetical protein